MTKHVINVDTITCVGCGLCRNDCPAKNIEINDGKANIIEDTCLMCGHCFAVCPKKAIIIYGYDFEAVKRNDNVHLDPNKVLEVIRFRRTIRHFQKKEVPSNVVKQILEAGRLTHTAKNMQDVSFVVLDKEKEAIEQMAVRLFKKIKPFINLVSSMARRSHIHDHFFFCKAPIIIVILAKNKENGILAAQNMEFVAEANGLGVLFSGFFTTAVNRSKKISKSLGIPKGKKAAATLVLGYPAINYLRSAQREKLDVKYM